LTAVAVYSETIASAATTDSTSYVDVTDAMTGLSASTKYLVIVHAIVGGDSAAKTFGWQLVQRGDAFSDVVAANSEMIREPYNTTKRSGYAWAGIITTESTDPDGGFVFQHKAVSSGTATTEYVTVTAIELTELTEGNDYFVTENTSAATHTTTLVSRASHEIAAVYAKDETWMILGFIEIDGNNSTNSSEIVLREQLGDAAETDLYNVLAEYEDTTDKYQFLLTYAKAYTVDESATYTLYSRDDGGVSNLNEYKASTIIGLRLSAFEQYAIHYTSTPDLDNPASFNDRFTGTITPDTTGEVVYLSTMIAKLVSTGRSVFERLQVDDVSVPNALLEAQEAATAYDNTDLLPMNIVTAEAATADTGYDYALQFKETYADVGVNSSALVAFSTELSAILPITYSAVARESFVAGNAASETFLAGSEQGEQNG